MRACVCMCVRSLPLTQACAIVLEGEIGGVEKKHRKLKVIEETERKREPQTDMLSLLYLSCHP